MQPVPQDLQAHRVHRHPLRGLVDRRQQRADLDPAALPQHVNHPRAVLAGGPGRHTFNHLVIWSFGHLATAHLGRASAAKVCARRAERFGEYRPELRRFGAHRRHRVRLQEVRKEDRRRASIPTRRLLRRRCRVWQRTPAASAPCTRRDSSPPPTSHFLPTAARPPQGRDDSEGRRSGAKSKPQTPSTALSTVRSVRSCSRTVHPSCHYNFQSITKCANPVNNQMTR